MAKRRIQKITGPDTLDRWEREDERQHRALLLFAMQEEGVEPRGMCGRNLTAVKRAAARSLAALKNWATKRRWAERIEHHGDTANITAYRLYRLLYMEEYGASELAHIQHLVNETMLERQPSKQTPDRTSTDIQDAAAALLGRLIAPAPPTPKEERVKDAIDAHKDRLLESNTALRGLARQAIVAFKTQLDAGTVKVRVGDLERIHDLLGKLDLEQTRLTSPGVAAVNAPAIIDSVRVKLARETGGNELVAIQADLHEATLIIDQMLASDDQRAVELEVLEGGVSEVGEEAG